MSDPIVESQPSAHMRERAGDPAAPVDAEPVEDEAETEDDAASE